MTKEQLQESVNTVLESVDVSILDIIDFHIESQNIQLTDELYDDYVNKVYHLILDQLKELRTF
jgi:hypothetical protein|tara:strand:- start:631 stop:819 length:189 start_codon:yes stop_codon:yes gene_type:complete